MVAIDVRPNIVAWAKWGVANHGSFTYSEGAERMSAIKKPGVLPVTADCSAFATLCYAWAGAPDPNGQGYDGFGYTGTLLSTGRPIALAQVQPGDLVVYGPGTGEHVAIVVEAGPDPLTVSHGQQGDPSFVRVSQDGRQPQRYLRFNTIATGPAKTPILKTVVNVIKSVVTPKPSMPVLQLGTTLAASTRKLQSLLHVPSDGVFGPVTQSAVVNFQKAHGLAADGVVGPVTWRALGLA